MVNRATLQELFQRCNNVRLARRLAFALTVLAVATRFAFLAAAPGIGDPTSMDAQNYLRLAGGIRVGEGFSIHRKPSIFVAPLYPALLAGLQYLFGDPVRAVRVFQALLGGLTVLLVFRLARELLPPAVALIAAGFFAFHPELIALTAFVYTETVFIFLFVLTLLLLARALRSGRAGAYVLAGVALGVTNLCRGILMYLPVFLLLLFAIWYRDAGRRQRLTGVLWLTLAMAAVMTPWTVRNYLQFRAFVPVASGLGDVLWTGNYLPFDGEFRYGETQRKIQELVGGATYIERDRILIAEAKKNMLAQPAASAWLLVRKAVRYWTRVYQNVPRGGVRDANPLIWAVLAATHYLLLLLAALGVWKQRPSGPLAGILFVLILYYTLIHMLTLPVPRYRQPLLPALCIFAAAGVSWMLMRRKGAEEKTVAPREAAVEHG